MTIVDKIKNSIKAALNWTEMVTDENGNTSEVLHEFPVYYHDDATLNLMTDTMDFPCAIVLLLTTGNVDTDGGQRRERVSAAVFFVEPSDFDFDADENEAIIDRCKTRGFDWLGHITQDHYITATLTRTERTYNRYDDILTGMGFLVEVTELQGWTGCSGGDFNDDFNNDFN